MKITPLGLLFKSSETEKILNSIEKIAYYSHYTDAAISAAAAVAGVISAALENKDFDLIISSTFKLMQKAENYGLKTFQPSPYKRSKFLLDYIEDQDKEEALDFISQVLGTGINSFEVLPAALAVFKLYQDQPKQAIEAAVGLGGDTDTIAALTGSFIGAYYGPDVFAKENLDYLFEVNDLNLEELAADLIKLR
jgi:ADP-ribosylglycohydrolase